jgi:SOS-response transcriptional repressor LexA/transcriptional regulator with XRE-family HTH domain
MHPPTDPHVLGQRIVSLRHGQGWSQRRLAVAAGVSHGYIALLELGRLPSPGKFRLDAIARALNLRTADALLGPLPASDAAPDGGGAATATLGATPAQLPRAALSAIDTGVSIGPRATAGLGATTGTGASAGSGVSTGIGVSTGPRPTIGTGVAPAGTGARPGAGAITGPGGGTAGGRAAAGGRGGAGGDGEPRSGSALVVAANVLGSLDQLRQPGAQPLPVFRWGSCGDPRDRESPPDPDHLEFPPPGRETLIGPNGFGVMVKGDSMAGRGIDDGDVVWVNPDRAYQIGKVVLALVSDVGGDAGMVVKTYARTEVGECLVSETAAGRSPVVCREFKIIGPVVGITSWRLPN